MIPSLGRLVTAPTLCCALARISIMEIHIHIIMLMAAWRDP